MKHLIALLIFLPLLVQAAAQEQESAYAVRQTEVKKEPFTDAATVATLAEKSRVTVLARQGGWMHIKGENGSGWVRMLSLRLGNAEPQHGDSGLQTLFNVARSGSSGTTVATGVRGLSEEDLKNAHPDPRELEKMHDFSANKPEAEKFALNSKLRRQSVDYLPAPNTTRREEQ